MSHPEPDSDHDSDGFDSRDALNVIIDGPGDTTVRPASPAQMRWLVAERERLARLLNLMEEQPASEKPPGGYKTSDVLAALSRVEVVNVIIDGPGDTTVRPAPPERMRWVLAERERLARIQKLMEDEARRSEKPPDESNQNSVKP